MKARKVVTRSGKKTRGYMPSLLLNRMVEWESLLERDAILLLEFSRGVKSYQEQPEQIRYADGDEIKLYYPDFEVLDIYGKITHIEVKPESKLAHPEVANKLSNVAAHYAKHGPDYQILTEKVIRREPLISNLKMLMTYRRMDESVHAQGSKLLHALSDGPSTFGFLALRFESKIILKMIALGFLSCDLDAEITEDSLISQPGEAYHAPILF